MSRKKVYCSCNPSCVFLGLRLVVCACTCCGHDGHVKSPGSPPEVRITREGPCNAFRAVVLPPS